MITLGSKDGGLSTHQKPSAQRPLIGDSLGSRFVPSGLNSDAALSSTEKANGVRTPEEPSNPDIYCLVNQLIAYLLDSSESNHRIYNLLARFASLQLSTHEFTCLKFLAIFNPHKHGPSYCYDFWHDGGDANSKAALSSPFYDVPPSSATY
ncbi:unnamed protein product [Schistocephalus solidus]|uniref:CCR4-NOT transcription complex subunit 11 n=1 Tax=Schistocephalus solidus TaxID=70667 RepID=A0A183S9V5_SCHSO|nr:unnamed protein product [Schistocephalus solidus]